MDYPGDGYSITRFPATGEASQPLGSAEEQLPDIPDISDSGGGAGISEEQLMAFIAELPDGCRTVFNLYVFEEKSHKEIAKMLHIKEHSSTSQLHRAKYLLAKRIKEYRNHEERK